MINKDVRKYLERKKVNEIIIWSWNDSTGKSTTTTAMVATTAAGTALTTGTAIHTNNSYGTQAFISLTSPTDSLAKELDKYPIHEQHRLEAQLHAFLLQDSPNIT